MNVSAEFIEAASVPLDAWHATGTLERAAALLAANPSLPDSDIFAAAVTGNAAGVRRFLVLDRASATRKGGPRKWDPLTYLCFSRFLKLELARSAAFTEAATALLDAGADPNTGFFEADHQPMPQFESVLYGAAGIAHNAMLTRLLLERGADPNDGETAYHSPETYDNDALKVLVQSGKVNEEGLSLMLVRKHDWHDEDGVAWLLEQGVNPNASRFQGLTPVHHAVSRDNALPIFELLLDYGADMATEQHGASAAAVAARRGRGDLLQLLERRGKGVPLRGADQLVAACARGDEAQVREIASGEPALVKEIVARGAELLSAFAGNGNSTGVRLLLDLGVPVDARLQEGNGYWDQAPGSTALHHAAWRARPDTVRLLLSRGADANARDSKGRTPLTLAVRATVDSYWVERRSPDSVAALLAAGASPDAVSIPCGYEEVDRLFDAHR